MTELSTRPLCLALLSSLAASLGFEPAAGAQVPVFVPTPDTAADAVPAVDVPQPGQVAPAATTQAPAPLPSGEPRSPTVEAPPPPHIAAPRPAEAVQPAKAAIITARRPDGDIVGEEEDDDDVAPDPVRRPRWYGWETLIADGSSVACMLMAVPLDRDGSGNLSDNVLGAGLLGYEFAPPILHFVHRNPGRGFASMGIRLGMPLAGGILGATLASNCNANRCEEGGATLGLLLGMAGAMAIDAAVFAYEDPKHPDRRFGFRPMVSVAPRAAWLGVGGNL